MLWSKGVKACSLLILILISLAVWLLFIRESRIKPPSQLYLLKHFSFSKEDDLKEWKEKVFKGRVKYTVENFRGENCVYARSKNSASGLYYKIRIDMGKHPVLSWRWNVIKFPEKKPDENLTDAREDDYGARMYVIFPTFLPGAIKALEYIWTEHAPKGTICSSPYSSGVKLIVLENGYSEGGNWIYEKRDLYQDYIKAFGKEPNSDVNAIVFMTDADSTTSWAEAVYDDIKIEYKEGG